ncbi:hypothetical protein P8935_18570 [Telmatobacter sp. DSM 110680]|uniref:Uncharacterized protein n=1 Tax=Telmatobacter sp. DSM 110680 TaxID=3036704 RepID=A0AAU7DGV6_9BACT
MEPFNQLTNRVLWVGLDDGHCLGVSAIVFMIAPAHSNLHARQLASLLRTNSERVTRWTRAISSSPIINSTGTSTPNNVVYVMSDLHFLFPTAARYRATRPVGALLKSAGGIPAWVLISGHSSQRVLKAAR